MREFTQNDYIISPPRVRDGGAPPPPVSGSPGGERAHGGKHGANASYPRGVASGDAPKNEGLAVDRLRSAGHPRTTLDGCTIPRVSADHRADEEQRFWLEGSAGNVNERNESKEGSDGATERKERSVLIDNNYNTTTASNRRQDGQVDGTCNTNQLPVVKDQSSKPHTNGNEKTYLAIRRESKQQMMDNNECKSPIGQSCPRTRAWCRMHNSGLL